MADNNQLVNEISGLDFNQIKESFKTFLRNQTRFTDYDFEGSNLSALLDVLAYDTFYKAFLANMLSGENNLSTATKRKNLVARAKDLGYVPRSVRSSKAILNVSLTPSTGTPATITVPKGTRFTTEIDGTRYTYQTLQTYDVPRVNNAYNIQSLEIVEGRYLTHKFTITEDNLSGVIIPNKDVDTSRLLVKLKQNALDTTEDVYTTPSELVSVEAGSFVYYLEEVEGEKFRVYFGDDIIGKALVIGNIVTVEYLISSGSAPNGAAVFTTSDPVPGATLTINSVVQSSQGGGAIETMQSVRFNTPILYQAQNRAVQARDYVALVKKNFADYSAAIAWGGEDNDPVALGYVFVSIKPSDRDFLTETEKAEVENYLSQNHAVLTVVPIVVDPEFIYLNIDTKVRYKPEVLLTDPVTLTNNVKTNIVQFGQDALENFGEYFRYSRLVRVIDDTDVSITNSTTEVKIERRFEANNQAFGTYKIKFFNALKPGTIRSEQFKYTVDTTPGATTTMQQIQTVFIKDITGGVLQLWYVDEFGDDQLLLNNGSSITIGGTDYSNGILDINMNNFKPDANPVGINTTTIRILAETEEQDVFPVNNTIIVINSDDVTVAALKDPT